MIDKILELISFIGLIFILPMFIACFLVFGFLKIYNSNLLFGLRLKYHKRKKSYFERKEDLLFKKLIVMKKQHIEEPYESIKYRLYLSEKLKHHNYMIFDLSYRKKGGVNNEKDN